MDSNGSERSSATKHFAVVLMAVAMLATTGCSNASGGSGETVVVHIPYSTWKQDTLFQSAISENFDVCRKDANNRITITVDGVPPGVTIAFPSGSNREISVTSAWMCKLLLED